MTKLTLIDSSYIDWCSECGAALMPENQTIHSEWHRDVRNWVRAVVEAAAREAVDRLYTEEAERA